MIEENENRFSSHPPNLVGRQLMDGSEGPGACTISLSSMIFNLMRGCDISIIYDEK